MTVQVRWLVENRVILVKYTDVVSTDEIIAANQEAFTLRVQAAKTNGENGYLVHTISDTSGMTKQTTDLKSIRKIISIFPNQANLGWSLSVANNSVTRFFLGMGHQFAGVRYKIFETYDEAIEFLKENDADLIHSLNPPA